ncbi:MAG: hypothetical protein HZC55_17960, partial [Verrucomicrobia bacterium]|nr:hypothetical protein [Verrucomicrobiota bacterium]
RFSYPPFNGLNRAPPIYVGEHSNLLFVFTDATDFMVSSATVVNDVIEFPRDEVTPDTERLAPGYNWRLETVEILAPVEYVPPVTTVPDAASTAGLVGAVLLVGLRLSRRPRR